MITIDVLDRNYAKKLASGIKKIEINSTNDGLYFVTNSGTSFDVKLPNFHNHLNKAVLDKFSYDSTNNQLLYDGQPIASGGTGTTNYVDLANKPSINGVTLTGDKSLSDLGITNYNDTQIKADIANLKADKQDKTDNALNTTDKTVVGAINEINGNQLDTVGFSSDYKNIILNRKNGKNPYTIPITSIIHNAKLTELNDVDDSDIGNGKTLIYDSASKKHKYVDSTGTDELVKMEASTSAKYLSDLIDKQTIVNDNGVLKVKKLDGQQVTIAEINHLKGLTMNVMDLVKMFSNGGVKIINTPVATHADLLAYDKTGLIDGISYLIYVLADETHDNAKTTYLINKTSSTPTYFGFAGEHRDFTTNPIDLANEITGKLAPSNIDVDALWKLLTINDTYKTLTTKDEVFGTHGAKAMYDELVANIGKKANTTDLTKHTGDTNIHVTTSDKTKWNKVDNKIDKTDIVDNLTSTDTDKPLSANQGKVLDNKKLNKADVNKFDDLVNLDSVSLKEYILENCTEEKVYHLIARSTCTDTPKDNAHFYVIVEKVGSFTHKVTAKELNTNEEYICTYRSDTSTWYGWDKIALGDYNLKTYTDINQLGLIAPVTVGEIFSAMPNFSLLRFQVDNYSVTDAPAPNGILIIDKIRSAKFSIEFKISADGTVAQNSLYIGQLKGSDASGLTWQRLCTTSVADVNKTNITYNTGQSNYVASSLGETNFYSVTNGICQCSIYYRAKEVSQGPMVDIVTGLPKPKDSFYVAISQYTGNGAPCRGYLTLDGTFKVASGANGGSYMYTFSYPVRES